MKAWQAAGLFVSWAIRDAEEWFTVGPWSRARMRDGHAASGPTARLPWVGGGVSDRHQHVAIAAMGILVAAAAADGVRTQGCSSFFRSAVAAYGLHGFGHVGASVATRGYTPGVVTTPLTVLPYAAWAMRATRAEHGPLGVRQTVLGAALVPVSLGASHLVGGLLDRRTRLPRPQSARS